MLDISVVAAIAATVVKIRDIKATSQNKTFVSFLSKTRAKAKRFPQDVNLFAKKYDYKMKKRYLFAPRYRFFSLPRESFINRPSVILVEFRNELGRH